MSLELSIFVFYLSEAALDPIRILRSDHKISFYRSSQSFQPFIILNDRGRSPAKLFLCAELCLYSFTFVGWLLSRLQTN